MYMCVCVRGRDEGPWVEPKVISVTVKIVTLPSSYKNHIRPEKIFLKNLF